MYSQKTKYYTPILPVVALEKQQCELQVVYSSLYLCCDSVINVFMLPNVNELFYSKIILHLMSSMHAFQSIYNYYYLPIPPC